MTILKKRIMRREDIIDMIDFSKEEYNERVAGKDDVATFDEFIDNIINIAKENNGTIEDAAFIANDAFAKL